MRVSRRRLARRLGWSIGAVLSIAAAAVLGVTVDVHAAGGSAACGSAWDVVAGRSGWQQWLAEDLADPVGGAARLRTQACADAVNARVVAAALLAAVAVAGFALAAALAEPWASNPRGPRRRLRRLGTAATLLGGFLTAGGVVGLAILVADPDAPLFLYVDRPVVLLLGLLLLLPAVLVTVLGRGLSVLAAQLEEGEDTDETP